VPQEKWKHLTAPDVPLEKQPEPRKPYASWAEEDTIAVAKILGQLGKTLAGVAGTRLLPVKASVPEMLDSAVSSASRSAGPLHLLRRAWACWCLVVLGKACLHRQQGQPAWLPLRCCSALMSLEST
jgi:hypothetical protein